MVDRYACQFLTPFGSDTITSTIVQEDAIASEGIARQGRVQIGREREQKRADGNDAGCPRGDDQDYHMHDQSRCSFKNRRSRRCANRTLNSI